MFKHTRPLFEKGRILKTAMLESLRDYPRSFLDVRYQEYTDGIITGADIRVGPKTLTVAPGIIKYDGRLYLMEEAQEVPYTATGRETVLVVHFEKAESSADFDSYVGRLVLQERPPASDEVELGRFKLKEGAVLRSDYLDFSDLATEFNTLNLLHARNAGRGEGTLVPVIFKFFARELLGRGSTHPADLSFALLGLNQERIEMETLLHYLAARSGMRLKDLSDLQKDRLRLHQALVRILEENGGQRPLAGHRRSGPQRMMVD
ncbi:DNA and RNA helicase [Paenibacillus medicaginis]|uniref:DNA and RNA helicase n=1 Tax=Paenibacillus medicaginis TaxID=1470560 RepID=A0ABV5C8Q4_9BACL